MNRALPVGTRVQVIETGRAGAVTTTYDDREGAMWVKFDDGGQFVHYPEEVAAV